MIEWDWEITKKSRGECHRNYNTKRAPKATYDEVFGKHSVTETCVRYRVSRTASYKWKGRYDGSYKQTYGGFKRFAAKIREEKAVKKKAKAVRRRHVSGSESTGRCKTAVDEYSGWALREMYDEHSTYSSADFLERLIKAAPFKIKKIQTDNGTEYTFKKLYLRTRCWLQNRRIKRCSRMIWQNMVSNTGGFGP